MSAYDKIISTLGRTERTKTVIRSLIFLRGSSSALEGSVAARTKKRIRSRPSWTEIKM